MEISFSTIRFPSGRYRGADMNVVKKPDICRDLADKSFRHAFEPPSVAMTLEEITEHCFIETKPTILKCYLRWQREEMERQLVLSFLRNIDPIDADFLRYYYRDHKTVESITCYLPVSVRNLHAIKKRLLTQFSDILLFRLSETEAYALDFIRDFQKILAMRIRVFQQRVDLVIVEEWLSKLLHSYDACTSYLAFADTFVAVDLATLDAYHRVIRAKLEHPQACTAELADLAGLSKISSSTLHAYLKRYQGTVRKMLA